MVTIITSIKYNIIMLTVVTWNLSRHCSLLTTLSKVQGRRGSPKQTGTFKQQGSYN